ncbi:gamma-glutamylcyclotransferase family protein [Nocardia crassostreae]|uniref:gamma-glutamylcyclotransferase family protein n=1 Tax=Nocardia crassostreae TaxID=53428 RepID=UPI0008347D2E|nr:gamma-glutamylcyclotransferase family protein [Nocardia crassostreae]
MTSDRPWARRLPHPADPLFVYGTLQFPEVLTELIGRTPESERAVLLGRRAAALPEGVYPGLMIANTAVAQVFLLSGLTSAEWQVLDAFEDDEYDLIPVSVRAGEREVYAWTYAWTAEALPTNWSPQAFTTDHLPTYIHRCTQWRRTLAPATP